MDTSFDACRDGLRDALVEFVWKQWCDLGVAGAATSDLPWFIDPEPLILFSLDIARHDPRVFDEILDWLLRNGHWINVQRLVAILQADAVGDGSLVQAVAGSVAKHGKGSSRWNHAGRLPPPKDVTPKPLFIIEGQAWHSGAQTDRTFLEHGFERSPVSTRGMSRQVPMGNPRCVAFLVRSLFGVGARADVITYLAVRGEGHPSHIGRALGYSQKQVQDTLVEMAQSSLVGVQPVGHRKDYRLETARWWPFLYGERSSPPAWVDWRALVRGLSLLWRGIAGTPRKPLTSYLASSTAREAMRSARADLIRSGIGVSVEDDRPYRAEAYLDVFMRDVRRISERLAG